MNNFPFISVIVASYNRGDIIYKTIRALINQDYPNESYEVIVVDNNSSDNSVEIIRSNFKNEIESNFLKLLSLDYNSGSAGTYNEALELIASEWKYILKMDEDLIVDTNCISSLASIAVSKPNGVIFGGKVFLYQARNTFHAVGSKLSPRYAIAKGIGVNEIDHGQYDKEMKLDGLNGCMILISRTLKEKIGWFDKDYFLYYDDHDLMYKSLRHGYEHWYTPHAVGYHDTSTASSLKYSKPQWLYYSSRGSWLFLRKNFSLFSLNFYIYLFSNFLKSLLAIIFIILKSPTRELVKNLKIFFKGSLHGIFALKVGYFNFK